MFRIKICGVTNVPDALAAVDAGADAIGLNFFEKSSRYVGIPLAREVSDAVVDRVNKLIDEDSRSDLIYVTGVFVNHTVAYINRAHAEARLAVAQLHGDEPAEMFRELTQVPAIRVRRLDQFGLAAVAEDVAECRKAAAGYPSVKVLTPCAVLLDAASNGQYGGAGVTLPWEELADYQRLLGETPLILAGGLTPDNVAEAILIVRPHGVDVASGVESAAGKKDPHKVRDFIAAAKSAFAAISQ